MSNRIKRKQKDISGKKAQAKTTAVKPIQKSLVQGNPKLAVLVLVVTYFLLDYMMMDQAEGLSRALTVVLVLLAPSMLYSYYVYDYQRGIFPRKGKDMPRFVRDKKKYAVAGWLAIFVLGVLFLVIEPVVVPRFFPVLDSTYYPSQILLMLFVAPVMEEVVFRYLLYDRWLKQKWGWFWGFVVSSLLFVVCHPVTDLHSLIIYWAPTLLFFLVYDEFGLYGAMVIHMVYNMMAI